MRLEQIRQTFIERLEQEAARVEQRLADLRLATSEVEQAKERIRAELDELNRSAVSIA